MRWEQLFRDLEAQLEAEEHAELAAEVADRTRREWALVQLGDRLRPLVGAPVSLAVAGGDVVLGTLVEVGPDWLLVAPAPGRQALVVTSAVLSVHGLGRGTQPERAVLAGRLRLGYALRAVARDRAPVVVVLRDGSAVPGTIDRVGADFVELAEHPVGEPRRASQVRQVRAMPFGAVAVVHTG